jgi:hypothetical protein
MHSLAASDALQSPWRAARKRTRQVPLAKGCSFIDLTWAAEEAVGRVLRLMPSLGTLLTANPYRSLEERETVAHAEGLRGGSQQPAHPAILVCGIGPTILPAARPQLVDISRRPCELGTHFSVHARYGQAYAKLRGAPVLGTCVRRGGRGKHPASGSGGQGTPQGGEFGPGLAARAQGQCASRSGTRRDPFDLSTH